MYFYLVPATPVFVGEHLTLAYIQPQLGSLMHFPTYREKFLDRVEFPLVGRVSGAALFQNKPVNLIDLGHEVHLAREAVFGRVADTTYGTWKPHMTRDETEILRPLGEIVVFASCEYESRI